MSALEHVGGYLAEVFRRSERDRNFRIVCPDELESNLLGRVFDATGRAYTWPVGPDDTRLRPDGRVMEISNESICQAWLQGYLQTGRHGLFVGAELDVALLRCYVRWLEASRETGWREPVSSLTALLVGGLPPVLPEDAEVHVHLPADADALLATLDACLRSTDSIHLVVAPREPLAQ